MRRIHPNKSVTEDDVVIVVAVQFGIVATSASMVPPRALNCDCETEALLIDCTVAGEGVGKTSAATGSEESSARGLPLTRTDCGEKVAWSVSAFSLRHSLT